jgi:hypothetical protein
MRVDRPTTLKGIPFPGSDPKSGCKPMVAPIVLISRAEFFATGSEVIVLFHTFEAGKSGQLPALGMVGPLATAEAGIGPPHWIPIDIMAAASTMSLFANASSVSCYS